MSQSASSADTRPPILIGYFARRRQSVPDWLRSATVTEIGSVSECIRPGPENWIERWKHNDLFLFDSASLALSVVPPELRDTFDVFQYRAFPFRIDGKVRVPWDLKGIDPVTIDDDQLTVLGYDMVSRSTDSAFECSPLSCNAMADQWPTNQYCLIEDADRAIAYAESLSAEDAEPGPYCVIRVARVAPSACGGQEA